MDACKPAQCVAWLAACHACFLSDACCRTVPQPHSQQAAAHFSNESCADNPTEQQCACIHMLTLSPALAPNPTKDAAGPAAGKFTCSACPSAAYIPQPPTRGHRAQPTAISTSTRALMAPSLQHSSPQTMPSLPAYNTADSPDTAAQTALIQQRKQSQRPTPTTRLNQHQSRGPAQASLCSIYNNPATILQQSL